MFDALPVRPFVGRSRELDAFRQATAAAREEGGRAVWLRGATGIGKSRLAATARAEAESAGMTVACAQGYRIDQSVPYALWANAFQPLTMELDTDSLEALTRGRARELRWILPVGEGSAGEASPDAAPGELTTRIHWSFLELLRGLSQRAPLFVLLDDVHWADRSSLDLLHFVSRHLGEFGCVLTCCYNTDWSAGDRDFERLTDELLRMPGSTLLEPTPLDREECVALLEQVFSVSAETVAEFAAHLLQRTGGNPLFVEEVLKSLVAKGVLYETAGAWVGWDVQEIPMPETVRGILSDRVGALDEAAMPVVHTVAVSDSGAGFETLQGVTQLSDTELLEAIDAAVAHGILQERSSGTDIVYSFAHPAMREAVYEELGLARARVLHGAMAEALAGSGRASVYEVAHHHIRADDRSDDAVRTLAQAGLEALTTRANPEAVSFLERAREILAHDGDQPELRDQVASGLARALQRIGRYEDAAGVWEELLAVAEGEGEARRSAAILQRLGQGAYWQGRFTQAIERYDEALSRAGAARDREREGHLLLRKGIALQALGRAEEAETHMRDALAVAVEVGAPGLTARAHRGLMILHTWSGRADEAREHGAAAIELARSAGDLHVAYWVQWALGVLEGFLGNVAEMNGHMDACSAIAEELGSPVLDLWTSEPAIEHAAASGRWDDGIALGEQSIEQARRLGQMELLPRLLVWLSLIYFSRGEVELGTAYVDEAWELSGAGEAGVPRVHMVLPAYIGRVAQMVAQEEWERAIEVGEEGLRIAETSGFIIWAAHRLLPFVAEAYLQLGDAEGGAHILERMLEHARQADNALSHAWAQAFEAIRIWHSGELEAAADRLRSAADALEAIPMLFDAARLRRQRAGRLIELGDEEQALSELRDVHDIFRRLGARGELTKTREMFREVGARPPQKSSGGGAAGLTERELEIAQLVSERKSNKAIARTLDISPRTVSTHLSNVFRKLELGSRGELADFVKERGLLNVDPSA